MVPYNEPGDRAFWCISGKCLNPGCSPGRRPGARVQAGFYPAPSCPLLSVRLAGPRLIFVPPVHFSTILFRNSYRFACRRPRLTSGVVAATVMVVAGVGRCGGLARHPGPRSQRSRARSATPQGRCGQQSPPCPLPAEAERRPRQPKWQPEPCDDYDAPAWHTTAACAYTTGQDAPGWWPSAGANRLGRQVGRFQMRAHHGRSTVSSPTPVGESVPASGVQNLGEASVGAKPRSDK